MHIIVDNGSAIPIYEQIRDQIRGQIIEGILPFDTQLPSIRVLAKELSISIMTVKKAYDALEAEGFITTRQGKGSFVAEKNLDMAKEMIQKKIEAHMEEIVTLAKRHDISKEAIGDIFDLMFGDDDG